MKVIKGRKKIIQQKKESIKSEFELRFEREREREHVTIASKQEENNIL